MLINAHELSFSYGKHAVLDRLSLEIEQGEVVALLGPNGAGKTTLIELVLGFLSPRSGSMQVLGMNPAAGDASFWRRIGVVQQQWKDHPKWSVGDQLEWIHSALSTVETPAKSVDEALAEVRLLDFKNHILGKLSGGQRRRIDFAMANLGAPSLLILDEPTTGLDPVARNELHELLDVASVAGATILITTHDLAEAEKIASRILILNSGQIIANGSAQELRDQMDTRAEITWHDSTGERCVHVTHTPERFIQSLDLDEIDSLTITRPSLEEAYLELIGE